PRGGGRIVAIVGVGNVRRAVLGDGLIVKQVVLHRPGDRIEARAKVVGSAAKQVVVKIERKAVGRVVLRPAPSGPLDQVVGPGNRARARRGVAPSAGQAAQLRMVNRKRGDGGGVFLKQSTPVEGVGHQ